MEHLAAAGRRAVFALRRRCADLKINDPAIVCQLFDALVKPVISYGCELWVHESATESLEILHRSFLKSLLGVNCTTLPKIVLSEFGQFPLEHILAATSTEVPVQIGLFAHYPSARPSL